MEVVEIVSLFILFTFILFCCGCFIIKIKLNKPKSSMEVMIEEVKIKRYKEAKKKIKELEEVRERLDVEVIKSLSK
tara:strand:- start:189 stop:416 length:228 start_codon:yes stop_codon:yes gene_type:complete